MSFSLKYDPVEDTSEYQEAMIEIQPILDSLPNWVAVEGIWKKKTELLAERGIVWRNPRLMNPDVIID